jgi:hypothetical protein
MHPIIKMVGIWLVELALQGFGVALIILVVKTSNIDDTVGLAIIFGAFLQSLFRMLAAIPLAVLLGDD